MTSESARVLRHRRAAARLLSSLLLLAAGPAQALISFHGSSQSNGGVNTTVTINRPTITLAANGTLGGAGLTATQAGNGVGDLLIAVITMRDARSVTAGTLTWNMLDGAPVTSGGLRQYVFWRLSTTQDLTQASYTFNIGGGSTCWAAAMLVYRGVDQASPIDATASATYAAPGANVGSLNITAPAVTTTVADTELVITWGVRRQLSGSGFAMPAGVTERSDVYGTCDSNGPGMGVGEAEQAAAGAGASFTANADTSGSSRPESLARTIALRPAAVAAPVVRYAFDEAAWNGTANEVRNSAGAATNGQAVCSGGGCTVPSTTSTQARFCRSGLFDGSTQYVNVPTNTTGDTTLDITGNLTIAVWIRPDTIPSANLMSIASKDTNYEFHVASNGRINWWWDGAGAVVDLFTPNGQIAANTWTHVALVFTRGSQSIYINGVEVTTLAGPADSDSNQDLATAPGVPFQIAQDQIFAGRYFDGRIDELRVYRATLSEDDIDAIYAEVPPCSLVDHYRVQNNATAVNCQAESVTITAHDAVHTPVAMSTGTTITLNAAYVSGAGGGGRGDWSIVTAGGVLDNGTPDDGVASYTFATGESTIVLALKNTWAQTVNIAVTDGLATDTSGTASADAGYNQNLTFNAAGFRFIDGGNNLIPSQVAGVSSGALVLQAIESSACAPTGACTGVCTAPPGFASGTNVSVELASECVDPVSCQAGQLVSISNNGTSTIASNPAGSVASYTVKSLSFGANAQAAFTLNYPDVGAIRLHARYTIPLGAGGASPNTMSGASNAFVVKPYSFVVSGVQRSADGFANPGAANAAGPAFIAAGEDFTATVTAVNALGNPTPNYGREIAPEGARLTSALAGGLGLTQNPAIANSTGFGAFSAGAATGSTFSWGEVGIITLSAGVADGDYLGAGAAAVSTQSGNVGRFTPHHFVPSGASVTNRAALGCAPASNFTYLGEGIGLQFTLTARNKAAVPTQNYTTANGFAKMPTTPGNLAPAVPTLGYAARALVQGVNLTSRLDLTGVDALTWTAGQAAVATRIAVARAAAPDGPFGDVRIGIAPRDADGVGMRSSDFDLDVDAAGGPDHAQLNLGGVELRYGRLRVYNAVGSQLIDLPVSLETQYYSGLGFATNAADSCTALSKNAVMFLNFAHNLSACETQAQSPGVALGFVNGRARLILTKPGSGGDGNAGSVDLKPRLSAAETGNTCVSAAPGGALDANLPYLQFDWGGTGAYDQNPVGRASFGQARSTPEFIYFRENY